MTSTEQQTTKITSGPLEVVVEPATGYPNAPSPYVWMSKTDGGSAIGYADTHGAALADATDSLRRRVADDVANAMRGLTAEQIADRYDRLIAALTD